MNRGLLVGLLAVAVAPGTLADQPVKAEKPDACLVLNNRILGPRAADRLLPLLAGDPARGFRAACTVRWSTLSPRNQALPVTDCYQRSLLQIANDTACGRQTGPLWISNRWVVTRADLDNARYHDVICQQLETGTWAGTREFSVTCAPQKKELDSGHAPRPEAPSQPAQSPTPGVGTAPAPATVPAVTSPHPGR